MGGQNVFGIFKKFSKQKYYLNENS